MLRSTILPALLFPAVILGMTVCAPQKAVSQTADSPTSSTASSAAQTPAAASDALPDDPGTTAHVHAPVEPTGPTAVFDTSMGRMTCRLFSKKAPLTVANFVDLATGSKDWTSPVTHEKMHRKPLYAGTTFHRVIPGFMIQGGDPAGDGSGDPGFNVNDELSPDLNFDVAGRLAMANSGPNTNGSQFFITVTPQPDLDQHYSIFGQCSPDSVVVAESITQVPRDGRDKPFEPVTIEKVTIVPPGEPLPPPPGPVPAPTHP